ncbi:MAG TPA: SRPBCC domain-containing protein, partial [Ilumatobacteraceae bacterium]|nr:SRPBCC domain-containing protein [Ilumatobacteraceae bacterium]
MTQTATLDVTPVGDRLVRITRAFAAPRALVFDAHTRPELLRRWLGPASWTLTECTIDLRPGGAFRYVMHGPDDAEMVLFGEYREVDPPARIVATESFSDDWTGGETLNTTTFDEVGGITTVTVVVEFASSTSRDQALATGMEAGLTEGFERLDALVAEAAEAAEADGGAIGDRYRRRADRFDALVAAVAPADWDAPSPCAGWRARDVVGHIVDMHGVMLRPAGRELSAAPST